jgi:hypothetical protein
LSRDPAAAVVAEKESFAAVSEDATEGFSVLSLLPQEQRVRQTHRSIGSNMKRPFVLGVILFLLKYSFSV